MRTQSETFLASFPADPRSLEVKRLQHEADLGLLQRRLEAKARQRNPQSDAPLEAWLVEILRELRRDPDQAAQRLQALVDLNAGKEPREKTESNLLELAQRQLARLREGQAAEAKVHGPLMEQRVAEARALADSNPELAGKICRALIKLYGSKPWAEIWVAQAREMLGRIAGRTPTANHASATTPDLRDHAARARRQFAPVPRVDRSSPYESAEGGFPSICLATPQPCLNMKFTVDGTEVKKPADWRTGARGDKCKPSALGQACRPS